MNMTFYSGHAVNRAAKGSICCIYAHLAEIKALRTSRTYIVFRVASVLKPSWANSSHMTTNLKKTVAKVKKHFGYSLGTGLFYGRIANDLTGKPDAFSGFGTILKMIAPLAGNRCKFVISSIWYVSWSNT